MDMPLSDPRILNTGVWQVEVNGVWGYVCDDDFGFNEAEVVCRDLGYEAAETFTRNNHFGENSAGLLIP